MATRIDRRAPGPVTVHGPLARDADGGLRIGALPVSPDAGIDVRPGGYVVASGPLSGGPVIDAVEGFDPQQDSAAMFEAVQKRCAETLPVRYRTREGAVLEAACDAPLETPQVWAVAEAPPLKR